MPRDAVAVQQRKLDLSSVIILALALTLKFHSAPSFLFHQCETPSSDTLTAFDSLGLMLTPEVQQVIALRP